MWGAGLGVAGGVVRGTWGVGCGWRRGGAGERTPMLAAREMRSTVHPATEVLPMAVHVALVCDGVIGGMTRPARVVLLKVRCGRDVSVQVVVDLCGTAGLAVLGQLVALCVLFELAADGSLVLTFAGEMALRALQGSLMDALATAAGETAVEYLEVDSELNYVYGRVNIVCVERMLHLRVEEM